MRDRNANKTKGATNWLMLDLLERLIRGRTERLCEERGHAEGRDLQDWLKAQSEVLATLDHQLKRNAGSCRDAAHRKFHSARFKKGSYGKETYQIRKIAA